MPIRCTKVFSIALKICWDSSYKTFEPTPDAQHTAHNSKLRLHSDQLHVKLWLEREMKSNFYASLLLLLPACTTGKHASENLRDPWNGNYLHHSGRYMLMFEHFGEKMVEVKTFKMPRSNNDRPRMCFFAELKDNKLVYQAIREPDCRIAFQRVEAGIMVDDNCHGNGEDAGLFNFIESK